MADTQSPQDSLLPASDPYFTTTRAQAAAIISQNPLPKLYELKNIDQICKAIHDVFPNNDPDPQQRLDTSISIRVSGHTQDITFDEQLCTSKKGLPTPFKQVLAEWQRSKGFWKVDTRSGRQDEYYPQLEAWSLGPKARDKWIDQRLAAIRLPRGCHPLLYRRKMELIFLLIDRRIRATVDVNRRVALTKKLIVARGKDVLERTPEFKQSNIVAGLIYTAEEVVNIHSYSGNKALEVLQEGVQHMSLEQLLAATKLLLSAAKCPPLPPPPPDQKRLWNRMKADRRRHKRQQAGISSCSDEDLRCSDDDMDDSDIDEDAQTTPSDEHGAAPAMPPWQVWEGEEGVRVQRRYLSEVLGLLAGQVHACRALLDLARFPPNSLLWLGSQLRPTGLSLTQYANADTPPMSYGDEPAMAYQSCLDPAFAQYHSTPGHGADGMMIEMQPFADAPNPVLPSIEEVDETPILGVQSPELGQGDEAVESGNDNPSDATPAFPILESTTPTHSLQPVTSGVQALHGLGLTTLPNFSTDASLDAFQTSPITPRKRPFPATDPWSTASAESPSFKRAHFSSARDATTADSHCDPRDLTSMQVQAGQGPGSEHLCSGETPVRDDLFEFPSTETGHRLPRRSRRR